MGTRVKLTCEMDSGRSVDVEIDGRDFAAAEADPSGDLGRPATRNRFLAWNSAVRSGIYAGPFDQWNRVDCVDVTITEETGDEQGLDPGRTAPTDDGSWSSPSLPDSRSPLS